MQLPHGAIPVNRQRSNGTRRAGRNGIPEGVGLVKHSLLEEETVGLLPRLPRASPFLWAAARRRRVGVKAERPQRSEDEWP